jgi:hypothetical protein
MCELYVYKENKTSVGESWRDLDEICQQIAAIDIWRSIV